ncbi:MAG: hypothetical protein MZU95_14170 [Desulfomicrobium escambiense]|nr:hypothetical protein [Desulfomicrobium escambiense]
MTDLGIYRRLLSYIKPYRMKLVISLILTTIVAGAMPAIALLGEDMSWTRSSSQRTMFCAHAHRQVPSLSSTSSRACATTSATTS